MTFIVGFATFLSTITEQSSTVPNVHPSLPPPACRLKAGQLSAVKRLFWHMAEQTASLVLSPIEAIKVFAFSLAKQC